MYHSIQDRIGNSFLSNGIIPIGNRQLAGNNSCRAGMPIFNDLLYTKGKLLLVSNPNHALSGLVTLLMAAVVGVSILIGSPKKRFVLGIDAIILIILYISLILSLYYLG